MNLRSEIIKKFGVDLLKSSEWDRKNLRNYLPMSKNFCTFAPDLGA